MFGVFNNDKSTDPSTEVALGFNEISPSIFIGDKTPE
jgi:hypothetical protein